MSVYNGIGPEDSCDMRTRSRKEIRAEVLRSLEKTAAEKEEFWYRDICAYVLGHKLPGEDRIWLYKRLKKKNITILGMDPTERKYYKTWADEDGSLYHDLSRIDYEAVFNEIVRKNSRLAPLIDSLRHIRPPQSGEKKRLLPLLEKGDAAARERLIEMYLRVVVTRAYRWARYYDIDVEEAVSNACVAFVKLIDTFPHHLGDKNFYRYLYKGLYWAMINGQLTHNDQICFRIHNRHRLVVLYDTMKKKGCLDCDKLHHCNKAVDTASTVLQCAPETARQLLPSVYQPLSLEAYLETAGHTRCAGFCEEITYEEDDAPDYEEELTSFRIDPIEEAETELENWKLRKKLQPLLDHLTPREREIIELRNGIGCERQHTLEEIGQKYGVTRERIRQIEKGALKKLQALYRGKAQPSEQDSQCKDIKPQNDKIDKARLKKKQPAKVRLKKEKPNDILLDIKSSWRTNMKLRELLINYRIDHKLDRAKMAKLCGITEFTLDRLEEPYSMYCPRGKILLKIFENLEISEDTFMDVITHDERFRNMKLAWMWEQRNENRLLKYYHQLNKSGRELALAQMKALAELK